MAALGMSLYGLAYDPLSTMLGGTTGSDMYQIDAAGRPTAIGTLGASDVEGLAYDATARMLYGTTVGNAQNPVGRLIAIDPDTGLGTPVGALADAQDNGFTAVAGLAYDPNSHTLYGSDTLRDQLLRINRLTGQVTVVGALGFQDVEGLGFDPAANVLYGVDAAADKLVRINTTTGAATAIGALGFPNVQGLEFDATSRVLYGTDVQTLQLIRINTTTGLGTVVGSTAYKVDGLAGIVR